MGLFFIDISNPMSLIIFLSLMFFSFISWSIIFSKFFDLMKLKKIIKNQEELLGYCKTIAFKQWHKKLIAQNEHNLFSKLYDVIQKIITESECYDKDTHLKMHKHLNLFLEDEEQKRAQGLSSLATIANVSPYIGLLGTLAAMMQTFVFMSGQSGGIAELAPGLAEALQATAAGLLVAIPANIAYNNFTASYRSCLQKLSHQGEYFLMHIDHAFRSSSYEK